jgi:DNA-binding CsgD family transcriptional regulator
VALSDDQKAMLRLLAQREQGYDDIAALMGLSVDQVRAKVRGALAGLDQGLSQDQRAMLKMLAQREDGYDDIGALLGLSLEDVRAKVRGALADLDEPAAEKPHVEEAQAAPAPDPTPTAASPTPTSPPPAPKPVATAKKGPSRPKLPEDKGALRALAAGGAVVLVIVALLVTGVLGGGDSGSDSTTATTTGSEAATGTEETPTRTASGKEPTEAVLKAVDGSDASGQALFGRSGQSVILLLSAKGLQPSPKGQSYTVSLVRTPTQRLPLVATKAGSNGLIAGRFQVASQVLGLLAGGFDEMEISLVADDTLKAALAEARNAKKAPNYGGTAVLAGPVTGPIVEAGAKGK